MPLLSRERAGRIVLPVVLGFASLTSCGSARAWPMYQLSPAHNAVVSGDLSSVRWQRDVGSKINAGFAYDGKYLYTDDFAGEVLAIAPSTGKIAWKAKTDNVLMSTPAVADGMLYVGSGSNNIMWDVPSDTLWGRRQGDREYAFRTSDGHLMWSFHVPGEAMPSPAYKNGIVTFATGDGRAYALNARDGARVWATRLGGVATMASATIDGDIAFFAVSLGTAWRHRPGQNHVLAVNLRTGKIVWKSPYGNSDCAVTVADGLVFVEGVQDARGALEARAGNNVVVALDEKTGKARWQYTSDAGFFSDVGSSERAIAAMYNAGILYQALPASGEFAAFNGRNGKILWKVQTSGPVKMSGVLHNGKVYFADTTGVLYVVNASNGSVSKAVSYNKLFSTSPPLIIGDTLFIANDTIVRAIPLSDL